MSRIILRSRPDHPRVSSVLMVAGVAVAVASVFVPGFNGLSLAAAILAATSIARRVIENRRNA